MLGQQVRPNIAKAYSAPWMHWYFVTYIWLSNYCNIFLYFWSFSWLKLVIPFRFSKRSAAVRSQAITKSTLAHDIFWEESRSLLLSMNNLFMKNLFSPGDKAHYCIFHYCWQGKQAKFSFLFSLIFAGFWNVASTENLPYRWEGIAN